MTRTLILCLALLGACRIDGTVGSLNLSDDPDAGLAADAGSDAVAPLLRFGVESFLFNGDDMIFTASSNSEVPQGLLRRRSDGTIETLVADLNGRIAEDADAFYLAGHADGGGYLVAVDKTTLTVRELLPAGTLLRLRGIAVDDDWVYVDQSYGDAAGLQGNVLRVAKDGSASRELLTDIYSPAEIVVDDSYVYVAQDMVADGGRVWAIPKTGRPPFAVVTSANRPFGLLLVGDWLYFTERANALTDGTIARVARPASTDHGPTSTPETLVTGLGEPSWLAVADGQLYCSAYFSGLQRAPLDGGPAETLLGCNGDHEPLGEPNWPQGCGALAIHGDQVYFTGRDPQNTGALYAIPR